jgi:hypothetical protein
MAIAFVNAGTEATAAAASNLTLNAPASPVNDYIWVAVIHHNNHGATPSFTDWTTIGDYDDGAGNLLSLWYFRYAGSTPNLVYGSTADGRIGAIAQWSGCKTSGSPVNVLGAGANGSDASAEHTATTTTVANCMVLYIAASASTASISTLPTGTAAAFEDTGGGTQNCYTATQGAIGCSYILQASAGGTGSLTSTFAASEQWVTRTVALEPDVSSGQPAAKRVGGVMFSGNRGGQNTNMWRSALGLLLPPKPSLIRV